MNFKNGITGLGEGSVCFAEANGSKSVMLIRNGSQIRKVTVDLVGKAVTNHGVISLADECFLTATGRVEKLGEYYYVEDRPD